MLLVLGNLIDSQGEYNDSGEEISPPIYYEGFFVDASYRVPELEPYLLDPQPVTPAHAFAGQRTYHYRFQDHAAWEQFKAEHSDDEGNLKLTPPKHRPPAQVTMRQARLALANAGLLPQVSVAIDSLEEPQRTAASIEWDYSQVVERDRELVAMLGPMLGLDDEALDDLFREAAKL